MSYVGQQTAGRQEKKRVEAELLGAALRGNAAAPEDIANTSSGMRWLKSASDNKLRKLRRAALSAGGTV